MATLVKATGEVTRVHPKDGAVFSLEELQGFVGGYIEMVYLNNGYLAICDEEGKLKGYDINWRATMTAKEMGWIVNDDVLVGNVLFSNITEVE